MNLADICILVVLLVSVVQAVISGFFQEVFGIAGLVFGYLIAAWKYERLADYLAPYITRRWIAENVAFLVIFLGVMLVAGILGKLVHRIVKKAGLSGIDRFLGGLLGLVRGCLMVAIVLVSMTAFTPAARWLQTSALAPYFLVVGRAAIWLAPAQLRSQFYQGLDYLRRGQSPLPPHVSKH